MKIIDFDIGTKVTILTERNGKKCNFETEIIEKFPSEDRIVLKPIKFKEKYLSFDCPDRRKNISIVKGNKVIIFNDIQIKITRTKSGNQKYGLSIVTKEDVMPKNRRNFFRVFIGAPGHLENKNKGNEKEVLIKDISANGIGVISNKDLSIFTGTEVVVLFTDDLTNESYKLDCKIVRKITLDENTYLYGCQFIEENDSINKFVALKQRMNLK